MYKILKIVFVLVLLISTTTVGAYFYYKKNITISPTNMEDSVSSQSIGERTSSPAIKGFYEGVKYGQIFYKESSTKVEQKSLIILNDVLFTCVALESRGQEKVARGNSLSESILSKDLDLKLAKGEEIYLVLNNTAAELTVTEVISPKCTTERQ